MHPPKAVLLVHGAGSGPWVFDGWAEHFPGTVVHAVDLQQGLRVEAATMSLYAGTIVAEAGRLPFPLMICAWSMGGLAALMAAGTVRPELLVLLEPSPPAEVQGTHVEVQPTPGSFDPEHVYGPFPPGVRVRPESSLARDERRRGISVPSVPCPVLVVSSAEFAEGRGHAVARLYRGDELSFPDVRHFGMDLDPRVPRAIARYVAGRIREA